MRARSTENVRRVVKERLDFDEDRIVKVFLSHDVDWSKRGPPKSHVLKRLNRFPDEVKSLVILKGYNPYYCIPDIMDLEERYGFKSTFFFRVRYDDGSTVLDYEDDIKSLIRGGWEVGLHVNDPLSIESEIKSLELLNVRVLGARVHYLRLAPTYFERLAELGVLYDSSVKFCKSDVVHYDTLPLRLCGVWVFPITIMDAYMFTYMRIAEDKVVSAVAKAIDVARRVSGIVTIDWHQCSLKMIGGRKYADILEMLSSRDDVMVLRGCDVARLVG